MKRKIGEEFGFLGYVLKVEKATDACEGCFFFEHNLACHHKEIVSAIGDCYSSSMDNERLIFTRVM